MQALTTMPMARLSMPQDPYANSFRPRWQKSEEWKSKQLRGLGALTIL